MRASTSWVAKLAGFHRAYATSGFPARSTARPGQPSIVLAGRRFARRIADEAYGDVLTLLRNERPRLDALAEALLDQETLDADQAYEAVGLVKPPRREEHPPLAVAETSFLDGVNG